MKRYSEGAASHYVGMPTPDICALPVGQLATDETVLFLWCPFSRMPDGLAIMAAWGFVYKTKWTWRKPRIGTGNYGRNNGEDILIGVRKKSPEFCRPASDGVRCSSVANICKKPDCVYQMIEDACRGPYLELFGRGKPRNGWTMYGNQAEEQAEPGEEPETELERKRQPGGYWLLPPEIREPLRRRVPFHLRPIPVPQAG